MLSGALSWLMSGLDTEATSGGTAPTNRGHHRLLASMFPSNAHRVNVHISHSTGGTLPQCSPVPPPMTEALSGVVASHL